MNKKDFYKKLKSIVQSFKPYELDPLMAAAYKDDLPILIKTDLDNQLEVIQPEDMDMSFVRCFSSEDEFKSLGVGAVYDEMNLKLACELMIDSGFDGICFLTSNGAMLGLLWSDFIPKEDLP